MKKIWIGNLVLPNKLLKRSQITVEDGIITYIGEPKDKEIIAHETFSWENGYIWPGLIDIHIHGAGGSDFMDGTHQAINTIARTVLRYGVTGFLATTLTTAIKELHSVLEAISNWNGSLGHSELLGIHMEGPWINKKYKGAQNPSSIKEPREEDLELIISGIRGKLKITTLAPELPNGLKMIKKLKEMGIISSIGHTDATYHETLRAIHEGATHVTHTFNAMRGLHHREPGTLGAVLDSKELTCEIIADGIHVHPTMVKLLVEVKGTNRIILVSDSIRGIGEPEGNYNLGGLDVLIRNGKAVLNDDRNTIAGSLLTLNQAIMNMMEYAKVPIWEAVKMASLNPAKSLGMDSEIGSIAIGKRANLSAVDLHGQIHHVWMDGQEEYTK